MAVHEKKPTFGDVIKALANRHGFPHHEELYDRFPRLYASYYRATSRWNRLQAQLARMYAEIEALRID